MFKKILHKTADMFGFSKSTKYVNHYLHKANMRSGIYMAAIIVIIEAWMIIRQTIERVIPQLNTYAAKGVDVNPLQVFYSETSNFWLFLFMGVAMFAYCICSVRHLFSKKSTILALLNLSAICYTIAVR